MSAKDICKLEAVRTNELKALNDFNDSNWLYTILVKIIKLVSSVLDHSVRIPPFHWRIA